MPSHVKDYSCMTAASKLSFLLNFGVEKSSKRISCCRKIFVKNAKYADEKPRFEKIKGEIGKFTASQNL